MTTQVYAIQTMEFENGGLGNNTIRLFSTKEKATAYFQAESARLKQDYPITANESETHVSGYDSGEYNDYTLDLFPIDIE